MPKYIDADAFEDSARRRYCAPCRKDGKDYHGLGCRACWVDDMLGEVDDATAADVELRPRWVPISEALPEEGKRVLICGPRGGMTIAILMDAGENWYFWSYKQKVKNVVAWMTLPEPPKMD